MRRHVPHHSTALTCTFAEIGWSEPYRLPVSIPVIRSRADLHFRVERSTHSLTTYPENVRKPKKYVAKNGTESWRVRYRDSLDVEKSETFYDPEAAEEFSRLLSAIGPARALDYIDRRQEEGGSRESAVTVDDLWTQWREWKGRRKRNGELIEVRSIRTLIDYDRMYAKHIKPAFGHRPANLIGQTQVQAWVDQLERELEPKTVADYHSLLHAMYLWGLHPSRALLVNDPCSETRLPKRQKKPPKGLRPDEWLILHAAARAVDPDAADLLLFMASTGWRWSECAALQVMSVDHDGAATYVTMGRVLRREGNTFVFVDDAKSEAGARRIRITGDGERMVLRRIEGKRPDQLVFTTKRGGRWRYEHFYRRVWKRPAKGDDAPGKKRILEEAARLGLDRPGLAPHALRHAHVGMLIMAGEPLSAIQKRLGHADIRTTANVYGRMIDDASEEGLAKVDAMLSGTALPSPARPELES